MDQRRIFSTNNPNAGMRNFIWNRSWLLATQNITVTVPVRILYRTAGKMTHPERQPYRPNCCIFTCVASFNTQFVPAFWSNIGALHILYTYQSESDVLLRTSSVVLDPQNKRSINLCMKALENLVLCVRFSINTAVSTNSKTFWDILTAAQCLTSSLGATGSFLFHEPICCKLLIQYR